MLMFWRNEFGKFTLLHDSRSWRNLRPKKVLRTSRVVWVVWDFGYFTNLCKLQFSAFHYSINVVSMIAGSGSPYNDIGRRRSKPTLPARPSHNQWALLSNFHKSRPRLFRNYVASAIKKKCWQRINPRVEKNRFLHNNLRHRLSKNWFLLSSRHFPLLLPRMRFALISMFALLSCLRRRSRIVIGIRYTLTR